MEGEILFGLELDFLTTQFQSLIKRAVYKYWDPNKKKYMWVFSVKDVEEISGILGKPITFEAQKNNIDKLIDLCPPLKERILMDRWKGKGEYSFVEEPEVFLVGEWQKNPRTGKPEQAWISIPKKNVLINWEVIKGYPKDQWVRIRTQAEHVCRRMGFDRVFRDSGTFDWSKFTGLHRKGHLPYVYYPVKVLAHLGVISYSKVGKLKSVSDNLNFQYHFVKEGIIIKKNNTEV